MSWFGILGRPPQGSAHMIQRRTGKEQGWDLRACKFRSSNTGFLSSEATPVDMWRIIFLVCLVFICWFVIIVCLLIFFTHFSFSMTLILSDLLFPTYNQTFKEPELYRVPHSLSGEGPDRDHQSSLAYCLGYFSNFPLFSPLSCQISDFSDNFLFWDWITYHR